MVTVGDGIVNCCNACGVKVEIDQAILSEQFTGEVLCEQCYCAEMKEVEYQE